MKRKLTYGLIALTALGTITGGVLISEGSKQVTKADTTISCASIHFGMDDSTLIAKTYGSGNSTAFSTTAATALTEFNANYSSISGITVTAVSVTNVYKNVSNYKLPIRFNKSSGSGTLTLTLNSNIIGATVYAVGWGASTNDTPTIKVNDVEKTIDTFTTALSSVTAANAVETTYKAYSFTFDSTNTLSIVGSTASKGRFFMADIAFRLA